jgi:hypothetical protein
MLYDVRGCRHSLLEGIPRTTDAMIDDKRLAGDKRRRGRLVGLAGDKRCRHALDNVNGCHHSLQEASCAPST